MKLSTKILLPVLTIVEHKNLTTLVEERLDAHIRVGAKKQFSQTGLWNIHNQRKTFTTRRYMKW